MTNKINYQCTCGRSNVKLWREYNVMFADRVVLKCSKCLVEELKLDNILMDEYGRNWREGFGWTDQFGYYIPAVPTIDNLTYWGYSSVPEDRVKWWQSLAN